MGEETLRVKSIGSHDLDADGDIDIVAAYFNNDKVVWYENIGDGTFYPQKIIIENIDGPTSVFIEDLDNDGIKDVLISAKNAHNIKWFKNDGAGNFEEQDLISDDDSYSSFIYSIDMDLDGDNDIIATSPLDDEIIWFENEGGGSFSEKNVLTGLTDVPTCIYWADLDGDLDLDLISSSKNDDKIAWYENLGGGLFSTQNIISLLASRATSVFADDLDADGLIDIISTSDGDSKVAWYKNEGAGIFGAQQIITTETDEPIWTRTIDFDSDGDLDIISASIGDDKLAWYENYGLGAFGPQQIISEDLDGITQFQIEDMNDDTFGDIIVANFFEVREALLWLESDGTGEIIQEHLISDYVYEVKAVHSRDINNDGFADLFSIGDRALFVQKNRGDGTFNAPLEISTFNFGSSITTIDVDNDGILDVVAAYRLAEEIAWYKNLGDFEFGERIVLATSAYGTEFIGAHDLNGDGFVDIICAMKDDPIDPYDNDESRISWYENDGIGGFLSASLISTEIDKGTSAFAIDLDGDGDLDALSSSYIDDKIAWYENDGTGTFGEQQIISAEAYGAEMVSAADLDGDGDNDVLSACRSEGKMAWYRNDGIEGFSEEILLSIEIPLGNSIYPIDQDGDGDMDIIAIWNSEISLFENTGDGVFEDKVVLIDDHISNFGIVSDFDNDNDIDVVYGASDYNKLAWIENYYFSKQLKGQLYFDGNENGVRDSLESGFELISVLSSPDNDYAYTAVSGAYLLKLGETDYDTYEIYPEDIEYWHITSAPLSYAVTVDSLFSFQDSLDFGFFPDTIIDHVETNLTGAFPRCNSIINYWLDVKNIGTTIPSGIINLILDEDVLFESASITPDSIIDNSVYWYYDSLFYFSNEMIKVQVQMPDFMLIGDTLTSYLNTNVDSLGLPVFEGHDTLSQILVCAYDPNDKMATPKGIDSLGYIPITTESIDYLVRFQNTGNDTAFTVLIKDQLDTNLIWSSLNVLSASHELSVESNHLGEIKFIFDNIMLPDSNVNEIESHGFVKYRINIDSLISSGTEIKNTAHIYFDENPPVITNTKINTIYDCNTIMEALSINLDGCENYLINGYSEVEFPNITMEWEIEDIITVSDTEFEWLADTSGFFDLNISLTTDFCSIDTVFNIEIHPEIDTILDNEMVCEGDSLLIFDVYQSLGGVYKDTISTIYGCDSILTKTLDISAVFEALYTSSICLGDSLLIFENYQSTEGIYVDSLASIFGCDSIINHELVVNDLPVVEFGTLEDDTLCLSEESVLLISEPLGGIYSGAGILGESFVPSIGGVGSHTLHYLYEDINSCFNTDSVLITVLALPDVYFYGLLDTIICIDHAPLELEVIPEDGGVFSGDGIIDDTFSPSLAGEGEHILFYQFEDVNGCIGIDSITLKVVSCLGINSSGLAKIKVYPNPFNNFTIIDFGENIGGENQLLLHNVLGQEVYRQDNISGAQYILKKGELETGVYLLSFINDSRRFTTRLIVQ